MQLNVVDAGEHWAHDILNILVDNWGGRPRRERLLLVPLINALAGARPSLTLVAGEHVMDRIEARHP